MTRLTATGEKKSPHSFPIVGVGASAGGLEAFTELLKHLPLDTGMGFVLVQHLDPQHQSALTQLLARATSMPVQEVTNNLRVDANHVYVIPPNTDLGIEQGVLKLQPREQTRTPHHSIECFFESLARDQRECAIGVILSGTASDGAVGMEAIKAETGITFAQDDSARYDSMPRSAIAAGCVDFVLSPQNIAKELARIAKHPYVVGQAPEPLVSTGEGAKESGAKNGFKKILLLLRNHSGVDFSLYNANTIQRRIARRMVLNKVNTAAAYADFLRGKAKELEALYSDLLIYVTSFFRNPAAFDILKEKVFPKLITQPRDQPLRAWVPGCSTGQEVYSIAMAFVEFAEQTGHVGKLQLFATDVNEALLDKARAARYAESLVQNLSPQRLRRFFVKEDGGYRAAKFLREMVVFARQNLLSDPPFSRMDLISCRNLLIYLEADAQRKVLPTLHYALKPEGFLFLGESESLGTAADLFETVDKKYKIFSKKPGLAAHPQIIARHPGEAGRVAPRAPGSDVSRGGAHGVTRPTIAPEAFHAEVPVQREADRVTLNRYAPPSVLLNFQWHVLQFRGETNPFLKPPSGYATFHVLKMAREGLMLPLRTALKKAKEESQIVRREGLEVVQNGGTRRVNFDVVPLTHLKEQCYLVFFEDAQESPRSKQRKRREEKPSSPLLSSLPSVKSPSRHVTELERELSETRDYLQSFQEQYEATNEELQSSNEEVTSANEELQSVNEELETSKEELESSNEELTTVNDEMANRNAELNRANADLNNLHVSVKMPILVLSRDLAIRRFTPPAEQLFNLVATDAGRPLSTVRHNLDLTDLESLLREVIDTMSEREREVRDKEGRWYSLRARPYLTLDNKIDGAVLTLVDIDALKRSEHEVAAARDYAANTIETVRDPLLVLDAELRVESANRSFYRAFRVSPEHTIGEFIYALGHRQWDIPELRTLLEKILPQNSHLDDFQVEHDFEQLGRRSMRLNARRIHDPVGKTQRILLAIEDVTERKQLEKKLESARIAEAVLKTARDPLLILDADLRVHLASKAFYSTFHVSPAETEGRLIFDLGNGQWKIPRLRQLLEAVVPRNSFFDNFEVTHHFEGIGHRTMLLTGRKLAGEGAPDRILLTIQDITEVLQLQVAARESAEKFKVLFERSPLPAWVFDLETLRFIDVNQAAVGHYGYSHEEFLRMSVLDLHTPEAAQAFRAALARPPHHPPEKFSSQRRKKSGEVIQVEVAGSEIQLAGRRVWLASVRDITERKRTEEALALAQAQLSDRAGQLEQAVSERTAELTATNKQLEAFVYSIAHDLRAPLRSMQGLSTMLVDEAGPALSETGRNYANRISKSAQFMDALLVDLLAFSRISQERIELMAVNLEAVLTAVLSRLEKEIQGKNARIEVLGPWPTVLAHEPILSQVVFNLVSNALKFVLPDVPPQIRIGTEEANLTEANKGNKERSSSFPSLPSVKIFIQDNGIGIAPEHQEQIFRLFNRLHGESYEGTGIGLAIVQKGVERMGGRVGVESAPGQGSRFWFELRRA